VYTNEKFFFLHISLCTLLHIYDLERNNNGAICVSARGQNDIGRRHIAKI
jgi:hypothetical protein